MNKGYLLKALITGLGVGTAIIALLTLMGVELDGYRLSVLLYISVFIFVEYKHNRVQRKKRKEFTEIDKFLSMVRHRFYVHGMADEAIQDVTEELKDKWMREQAEGLLQVLASEDIRNSLVIYRRKCSNKYLSLFATLCVTVLEYGDATVEEGSLFLKNLLGLKDELRNELEADQLLSSKMTGMGIVAVAPALCLGLIKRWAVSNLPDLQSFYEGMFGKTLMAALFLLSMVIYALLCVLRGVRLQSRQQAGWLRKLALKPSMHAFLYMLQNRLGKASERLQALMLDAGDERTVRELYLEKILFGMTGLTVLGGMKLFNALMGEEGISLIFIVLISLLAYFIPDLILLLKRYLNRISMEDEVMQYQTIISMLMFIERISIYEILEELEQFARIFKRSISDCINELHSGEDAALEALSSRNGCPAFKNLAEKLQLCDRIGVRKAFDEINADHEYYLKKRDRETTRNIQKKAVLGQFIAFAPLVLSVVLFLIIPFAKSSLEMLTVIGKDLNL